MDLTPQTNLCAESLTDFLYNVWILASNAGELAACQQSDQRQGLRPRASPNFVMRLSEKFGLLPGAEVWI